MRMMTTGVCVDYKNAQVVRALMSNSHVCGANASVPLRRSASPIFAGPCNKLVMVYRCRRCRHRSSKRALISANGKTLSSLYQHKVLCKIKMMIPQNDVTNEWCWLMMLRSNSITKHRAHTTDLVRMRKRYGHGAAAADTQHHNIARNISLCGVWTWLAMCEVFNARLVLDTSTRNEILIIVFCCHIVRYMWPIIVENIYYKYLQEPAPFTWVTHSICVQLNMIYFLCWKWLCFPSTGYTFLTFPV